MSAVFSFCCDRYGQYPSNKYHNNYQSDSAEKIDKHTGVMRIPCLQYSRGKCALLEAAACPILTKAVGDLIIYL